MLIWIINFNINCHIQIFWKCRILPFYLFYYKPSFFFYKRPLPCIKFKLSEVLFCQFKHQVFWHLDLFLWTNKTIAGSRHQPIDPWNSSLVQLITWHSCTEGRFLRSIDFLFVCFIYLVLKHSYQGLVKNLDGNEI